MAEITWEDSSTFIHSIGDKLFVVLMTVIVLLFIYGILDLYFRRRKIED